MSKKAKKKLKLIEGYRRIAEEQGIPIEDMYEKIQAEIFDNIEDSLEDELEDFSEFLEPYLLDGKSIDLETSRLEHARLRRKSYIRNLHHLQIELVHLQEWVQHSGMKIVVLFEGRDAAGKGGVIKRITQKLNPRVCKVVALATPTEREKTQWYFQRYVPHLPAAGEIVLFDRSWYNRAGVEKVMGFCTPEEYEEFFRTVPEFEKMLIRSGIHLIKYWFSVGDEEQEFRFQCRILDPLKQWKLSPMDLESKNDGSSILRQKR